jgi:hypothetical protein
MKGHENKKKYLNHRSWGKNGEREKKCMPCVVARIYSRILGGNEKGSDGSDAIAIFLTLPWKMC